MVEYKTVPPEAIGAQEFLRDILHGQRGRVARVLRCKSSEDGDGATVLSFSIIDPCRMQGSLRFGGGLDLGNFPNEFRR